MKIGITSPINPNEFKDFLYDGQDILNIEGAISVNALVLGLLALGHQLWIFSSYDGKRMIKYEGTNIHIFLVPRKGYLPYAFFVKHVVAFRLRNVIKQNLINIDVLHAHWTSEYAHAAKCFVGKLPVLCTLRDWCPKILALQTSWKGRIIWSYNTVIFKSIMNCDRLHFIANSEYIYDEIVKGYPSYHIDIVHNPIDSNFILNSDRNDSAICRFVSITQSILTAGKNYGNLLVAFSKYREIRKEAEMILIGAYDENNSIFQEWEKEGLFTNVTLMGFVPHRDLATVLDSCSALIHPSLEESFGNTLLEGMARKLPVIGGEKSGAVPKVLGYGKYGFLCNVENVDSIVEAMFALDNKEEVNKKTKAAFDYLVNNYSNKVITLKQVQLYEKYLYS